MRQGLSVSNKAFSYMKLLREIGIPGSVQEIGAGDINGAPGTGGDLLELAELNKIALLYLSALNRGIDNNNKDGLSAHFARLLERNRLLINTLKEVALAFNENKITY